MKTISLLQPTQIVFGNGCAPQCAEALGERGLHHVLVVTSSPVLGAITSLLQALREAGAAVTVYSKIDSEPTVAMFEDVLKVAESMELQAVVGVGGGSAMDVAKLVAALAGRDQQIRDVFGINRLTGP